MAKKYSVPNNNMSSISLKNQLKEINQGPNKNMTLANSKNISNYMGVFGVNPYDKKYKKQKKKNNRKIDCKTPNKRDIKLESINELKIDKRKSKSPFKMTKLFFNSKKEDKNMSIINDNKDIKENKDIIESKESNNIKETKDIKDNKENKDNNKEKVKGKESKKNKKQEINIYELRFYDELNEKVALLDGEGNSYDAIFERKDFQIKIKLNDNIFNSINDFFYTPNYFTFPQYFIHKIKYNSDSKTTLIELKDWRSFKIQTKDDEFYRKINYNFQFKIEYFKYAFFFNYDSMSKGIKYPIDGWKIYNPIKEFQRQNVPFEMDSFRISQINLKYKLCETYPSILVLPSQCDDSSLEKIASCRIKNRFPILTYAYTHSKYIKSAESNKELIQTFLFRSAQINYGNIFIKKNNYEVDYVNEITKIGKYNQGFVFYDCRPYLNAKANSLKGAGIDDISLYENCKELIFGCIENIHAVRKSLKKALEKITCGNSTINNGKISFNTGNNNLKKFLSKFEESKWLEYLSDIICGANTVINKILSKINVIVHCSDGWDRTSQVCSLVQIILDPYFRTFEGFAVLIEKDWVSFGHQFATRNGCDPERRKEKSPIFIQFLHAIYQLMSQYPNAFEFRENMLMYLADEIYSNKFGTFLFDSEKELIEHNGKETTVSIWSEILLNKKKYLNPFYQNIKEPLIIKGEVQYLTIWKEFFYKYIKIGLVKEREENGDEVNCINHLEKMLFKQKNSVIELLNIIKKNGLEDQIKNNDLYKIYKDYLDSK